MSDLLAGKVAIVTGIGPGIGRATAVALAREGADVALGARTEARLKEVANEIESFGRRAVFHPTNIVDTDDCAALAQTALDAFGRIDILVQNAFMHPSFDTTATTDPENWRRSFKVNVIGTLQMVQAVLPHLGDGASIIITNSMAARRAGPDSGAYVAAKMALLGLVRTLAVEEGSRGIRVNSVLPGWVEGPNLDVYFQWQSEDRKVPIDVIRKELYAETALKRIVSPEDVAGAIVFLASDLAHGVTGIALDVNGGHWLP
jgi:NAD(P)-dependent dehydrogenase (short-subunit alcohol dehydrogenase family)